MERHLHSLIAGALFAVFGASSAVAAAPPGSVEGQYQCDECQGLLTLKRQGQNELQVWLGVGGGSCGGEVLVNRKIRYAGGPLHAPHKQGQRQCVAKIEFTGKGAVITDSCFSARHEQNSTCAMLGSYTKQKQ
jgi:hypothetical protein